MVRILMMTVVCRRFFINFTTFIIFLFAAILFCGCKTDVTYNDSGDGVRGKTIRFATEMSYLKNLDPSTMVDEEKKFQLHLFRRDEAKKIPSSDFIDNKREEILLPTRMTFEVVGSFTIRPIGLYRSFAPDVTVLIFRDQEGYVSLFNKSAVLPSEWR